MCSLLPSEVLVLVAECLLQQMYHTTEGCSVVDVEELLQQWRTSVEGTPCAACVLVVAERGEGKPVPSVVDTLCRSHEEQRIHDLVFLVAIPVQVQWQSVSFSQGTLGLYTHTHTVIQTQWLMQARF